MNAVKEILLHQKRTLRDLAAAQVMSSTTVFRMKKWHDRVIVRTQACFA
jgi:DNA-binding Xre family transcriptional regulator